MKKERARTRRRREKNERDDIVYNHWQMKKKKKREKDCTALFSLLRYLWKRKILTYVRWDREIFLIAYIFAFARTCYNTVSEAICSSITVSMAACFSSSIAQYWWLKLIGVICFACIGTSYLYKMCLCSNTWKKPQFMSVGEKNR